MVAVQAAGLEELMAGGFFKRGKDGGPTPEGELRQSQMVMGFGPGAMVDLVNRAVVIGGLEHWGFGKEGFEALDDARLRRSLVPRLKALDPELDLAKEGYFRRPPEGDSKNPFVSVGVKALEFPRWFVCQGCRRLARAADVFENKANRYRHDCAKNKAGSAVPVRFVSACERGHLNDFSWITAAHAEREGGVCDRPELYLHEGATGDFGKIYIECANCNSREPMNKAMGIQVKCSGDRPWLGGREMNEPCDEISKLLVRTASHAYFAQVVSALRLPEPGIDPARERVRQKDVWKLVQKVKTLEELKFLIGLQDQLGSALSGLALDQVLAAINAERSAGDEQAARPLRSVEFERITSAPIEQPGVVPEEGCEFAAYRVPRARLEKKSKLPEGVKGLVIVPELREVRVQVSFSRFDSVSANLQGEYDFEKFKVKPAPLTLPSGNQKWLPAAQVRGEGIFIELDEDVLKKWEERDVVKRRADDLQKACERDSRAPFPGVRFFLLHSLSHLLLTAISLECGYSAASIRERIFCGPTEDDPLPMAGILLSTGTTGSEGTLGGLVEEGRRLRHHLREAWELGRLCSNDPVCAAHNPALESNDRNAEGAACHGCLYIAESSCERFNRFLDRALVVPTIGNVKELAFFAEKP
jgi:Domain of unknown function (DUF1998)